MRQKSILAMALCFFPAFATAQVPEQILHDTFLKNTPVGLDLMKIDVQEQVEVRDGVWETRASYTLMADETLHRLFEPVYETYVVTPLKDEGTFDVEAKTIFVQNGSQWFYQTVEVLNGPETSEYLNNVKPLSEWGPNPVLANTMEHTLLLAEAETRENEYYSGFASQMQGVASCRTGEDWSIAITWSPERTELGKMKTQMTLQQTNQEDANTYTFEGKGQLSEGRSLKINHPRTVEQKLGYDGRMWPSIVELTYSTDTSSWIGETKIPDTSVCDVVLQSSSTWEESKDQTENELANNIALVEDLNYMFPKCGGLQEGPLEIRVESEKKMYQISAPNQHPFELSFDHFGAFTVDAHNVRADRKRLAKGEWKGEITPEGMLFNIGESCEILMSRTAHTKEVMDARYTAYKTNVEAYYDQVVANSAVEFTPVRKSKTFGSGKIELDGLNDLMFAGTMTGFDNRNWPEKSRFTVNLNDPQKPTITFDNAPMDCEWRGEWMDGKLRFKSKSNNNKCMHIQM